MATEADSKIQAYHSEEQLRWLENELADAAASGKPAFVFNHFQLKDKFVSHLAGLRCWPAGRAAGFHPKKLRHQSVLFLWPPAHGGL